MKKKINEIIPLIVLAVWMAVCYPVCDKVEEFEFSYTALKGKIFSHKILLFTANLKQIE